MIRVLSWPSWFRSQPTLVDGRGRRCHSIGRLGLGVLGGVLAAASPASATGPLEFHTVPPCRVVDTRSLSSGGPALIAGSNRQFFVTGRCGIPAEAKAVSLTITAVTPATNGFLVLYPGGSTVPTASTINYAAGQVRANNAIVPLGAAGDLLVGCGQTAGTVHMIIDVNGYFRSPGCSEIPNENAILVSPRPSSRYTDPINAVHKALNPACTVNSTCPIAMQANAYRIVFAQKFREMFPAYCAGIQTDANGPVDEVCVGSKIECQGYHVFGCKGPPPGGCPPDHPDCGCDSGTAAWAPGSVRDSWRLPGAPPSCLPCPDLGKIEVKEIGTARVVFDSTPKTCADRDWNQLCSTGNTCSPGGVEGNSQRGECEAQWGPYSWSIAGQDCLASGACFPNNGNPLQVVVPAPVPHGQMIRVTGGNGVFGEAVIP